MAEHEVYPFMAIEYKHQEPVQGIKKIQEIYEGCIVKKQDKFIPFNRKKIPLTVWVWEVDIDWEVP